MVSDSVIMALMLTKHVISMAITLLDARTSQFNIMYLYFVNNNCLKCIF